ncbi:MAG: tetratricopeptide repeat protein [Planctomycetes bacterium]|nr:tetratricopeptide repeat protein [Planctomycetota bacterium]
MQEAKKFSLLGFGVQMLFALGLCLNNAAEAKQESQSTAFSKQYTGSRSCIKCHKSFYKLWSTSHHGLAMQAFSAEFVRKEFAGGSGEIVVGKKRYRAVIDGENGWICERRGDGEKRYAIEHAMGGKNVYYFLTPMQRGRLQVLPLAYDVRKKEWFNATASMIRHFGDAGDERLDWTDSALTFNTSCYSCHVSQLSSNYDLATDTYKTVWVESGINCDTCHGPCLEHVKVCEQLPEGDTPDDLKLISAKAFDTKQTNDSCTPCHAKTRPLTTTYKPGERFFDHYDLVTLENRDFYPDGRDLGENYTYTLWRMSGCAKSGKLDCMHCHTSSGRYRFENTHGNGACFPCHEKLIKTAAEHSHHAVGSEGSKCVSCHMAQTEFARMRRSDHSMLPPSPAATMKYKSPNACNLCHKDKTPEWADKWVRKWYGDNYQSKTLYRAGLVDEARKSNWSRLAKMLDYITDEDRDEIYVASLIRLLRACDDDRKWPALRKALKNSSPLVRSAAADGLAGNFAASRNALLTATEDDYLVVRIQAANALSGYPRDRLDSSDLKRLNPASTEFETSLKCRPDDTYSHYNLGNYYLNRGRPDKALECFRISSKLRPDNILPLVNASVLYAQLGKALKAEQSLRRALEVEPENAEANFNLALLVAEKGDKGQAEKCLQTALNTHPQFAEAAYNLGVLLAGDRIDEAVLWCDKAHQLRPNNPKYAYTLAWFLNECGDCDAAAGKLEPIVNESVAYPAAYSLLAEIYRQQGKHDKAVQVYQRAAALENGAAGAGK